MTREEQKQILNTILENIRYEITTKINDGRIPENWNGYELRELVKDKASLHIRLKMDRKRMREYKNTCLVNCL